MKREEYISDENVVKHASEAIKIDMEKKRALDIPTAVYDRETQAIYQENSDGTRIYDERAGKKPEVVVFAGPNGSGMSTFTELLKPGKHL